MTTEVQESNFEKKEQEIDANQLKMLRVLSLNCW